MTETTLRRRKGDAYGLQIPPIVGRQRLVAVKITGTDAYAWTVDASDGSFLELLATKTHDTPATTYLNRRVWFHENRGGDGPWIFWNRYDYQTNDYDALYAWELATNTLHTIAQTDTVSGNVGTGAPFVPLADPEHVYWILKANNPVGNVLVKQQLDGSGGTQRVTRLTTAGSPTAGLDLYEEAVLVGTEHVIVGPSPSVLWSVPYEDASVDTDRETTSGDGFDTWEPGRMQHGAAIEDGNYVGANDNNPDINAPHRWTQDGESGDWSHSDIFAAAAARTGSALLAQLHIQLQDDTLGFWQHAAGKLKFGRADGGTSTTGNTSATPSITVEDYDDGMDTHTPTAVFLDGFEYPWT